MPQFSPKVEQAAIKLLPLFAFVAPLALLYLLNPWDAYMKLLTQETFNLMWKGRTFELFFVWLVALEFILSWETIKPQINRHSRLKLTAVAVALALPTLYVLSESYLGFNGTIANWSMQNGIVFYESMPLATEYLAFAFLFALTAVLFYGKKGLVRFALPVLFALLVGVLYTIDNVFPYGSFTPFQLLVPTSASLASGVLGWMGYGVVPGTDLATQMPTLDVTGPLGSAKFAVAWPCAGIESLLIFTAVALLFLTRMHISWKAKIGYFALGAAVTYSINILRIANIFIIATQYGVTSHEVQMFHFYYGPLYAMTWIVSYPLLILGVQALWQKMRNGKEVKNPQPTQTNPI